MNIPRFWASSDQRKGFVCWQWSNASREEAKRLADEKSRVVAERLSRGEELDRYAYGNGAIREEIIQIVPRDGDEPLAVITRNLYGSLILNTKQVMFIDIDFPAKPKRGMLGGLFAKRAENDDGHQAALDKLDTWAQRQHELAMRIYRTCGGLRCLVTSRMFDPASAQSIALLESAGSDPLYIRLCKAQSCFRARLTPKPWRIGTTVPPSRYPFSSDEQLLKYSRWQSDYDRAIARFSVCRLVRQTGSSQVLSQIAPIVELHDRLTETVSNRPLA